MKYIFLFRMKMDNFLLFICFLENILFFILYSPQNYLYYISRKLSFNQFFFFFKWISRLLTYAHWEWHDWQITYKSPLAWNPRCMYYYSTLDILFYSQKFHVYSMYGLCWTNKVICSFRTVKWSLPIGGGTNAHQLGPVALSKQNYPWCIVLRRLIVYYI